MARDADGIIQIKYANSGDVGLGDLDLNELWPLVYSQSGGSNPERIQFNQLFRYLSALAVELNQKGPYLDYSALINYEIRSVVQGTDGNNYKCLIANGPDNLPVVDPVGDLTNTWTETSKVEAIGGTVVRRSSGGDIFGHNYNFDAAQLDVTISDIMCGFGDDGYIYKMSPDHVKAQLGLDPEPEGIDDSNVSVVTATFTLLTSIDLGTVNADSVITASGDFEFVLPNATCNGYIGCSGTATFTVNGTPGGTAGMTLPAIAGYNPRFNPSAIINVTVGGTLIIGLYGRQDSGGNITANTPSLASAFLIKK